MEYIFFDRDYYANDGHFDICGNDFKSLLNVCFQYSTTFSLILGNSDITHQNMLSPYMLYTESIAAISNFDGKRLYYKACPETKESLLKITDHLFNMLYGWGYNNPENPTFYRSDGSIFFSSIIHEGECRLFPRANEDVSSIISIGNWLDASTLPKWEDVHDK